jgi:hypothetical protein
VCSPSYRQAFLPNQLCSPQLVLERLPEALRGTVGGAAAEGAIALAEDLVARMERWALLRKGEKPASKWTRTCPGHLLRGPRRAHAAVGAPGEGPRSEGARASEGLVRIL